MSTYVTLNCMRWVIGQPIVISNASSKVKTRKLNVITTFDLIKPDWFLLILSLCELDANNKRLGRSLNKVPDRNILQANRFIGYWWVGMNVVSWKSSFWTVSLPGYLCGYSMTTGKFILISSANKPWQLGFNNGWLMPRRRSLTQNLSSLHKYQCVDISFHLTGLIGRKQSRHLSASV